MQGHGCGLLVSMYNFMGRMKKNFFSQDEVTGFVKASNSAVPVTSVFVWMGNLALFFLKVGLRLPALDFLFIGGSLRLGIFSVELSDGGEGV